MKVDKRKSATGKDSREDAFTKYWPELRGRVQEQWSRLTDDWLDDVDGRQQRLAEKLRDAYGISDQEANRQVDDFVATHWGAMSAGNLTPGSRARGTSDAAGSRGDTITNTPATAATGARGGGDTSGARSSGVRARDGRTIGQKAGAPRNDHHRH